MTAAEPTVHARRPAMGTCFEVWLEGPDPEHLAAVAAAALDEVARLDRLLSRHDPTAEVARLNREAAHGPVRVDVELFAILEDARRWFDATDGFFDVCAGSGHRFDEAVELDPERRTVRFTDPAVRLDFGGYGKGYALDAVGRIFEAFGVEAALAHGGTSSVLARGRPWRVDVRDPFGGGPAGTVELDEAGLSCSVVSGDALSDLIDPHTGRAPEAAGCVVVAPTALAAEVWSTACVAAGPGRAETLSSLEKRECRVGWVRPAGGIDWMTEAV